mgnify:CR=1 FL=1
MGKVGISGSGNLLSLRWGCGVEFGRYFWFGVAFSLLVRVGVLMLGYQARGAFYPFVGDVGYSLEDIFGLG